MENYSQELVCFCITLLDLRQYFHSNSNHLVSSVQALAIVSMVFDPSAKALMLSSLAGLLLQK